MINLDVVVDKDKNINLKSNKEVLLSSKDPDEIKEKITCMINGEIIKLRDFYESLLNKLSNQLNKKENK